MSNNRSRTTTAVLYGVAIFTAVFTLLPFVWLLQLSLKSQLDAFALPPKFLFRPTLTNYVEVLGDSLFVSSMVNSFIVATLSVVVSLAIAIPASYGLAHMPRRTKNRMLGGILLARMVPGMVFVFPFFLAFQRLSLLDTRFGLIMAYLVFNVPLAIWLLLPFWEQMPPSVEEAAIIDGASRWQVLRLVGVPLIRTGIAATAILVFIAAWGEFLFALILTSRDAVTLPVTVVNFMAFAGTEWGRVGAAGVLLLAPVLLFGFTIRKHLVQGVASGAVKG